MPTLFSSSEPFMIPLRGVKSRHYEHRVLRDKFNIRLQRCRIGLGLLCGMVCVTCHKPAKWLVPGMVKILPVIHIPEPELQNKVTQLLKSGIHNVQPEVGRFKFPIGAVLIGDERGNFALMQYTGRFQISDKWDAGRSHGDLGELAAGLT
ncbi:hypothetical protein FB451DRAFT_1185649 [Mycena latifolia]|nr:hypothetical protein FB451DRAFT_1185649 [Mycena latifolia]